ncbi:fibronectin type III domain-containing protein [Flavivirga rizhaonensis]|uniref:Fibronectin type-III domain-containing protein n=1 Tax=Flavivirga rizhaonensis TaxID=2559571 RepID=A0A4S1DT20_9FLAO|nr:fibronectin type III domain-containing protein [Flavivirga rizhaonensis]TGV01069.1 hypothetical protein EM932_17060 [Flavivirga rizhaonensis]
MKSIIKLIFLFICSISFAQTNLLDSSTWTEGTGSVLGFNRTGVDEENIREIGIGPHGTSVLLWKTIPQATGNSNAGGWDTDLMNIDPTKTYRFTVWLKKTNSDSGATYFRARAEDISGNLVVNNLDGTPHVNPYFWDGDPPVLDQWYLLVGFMHHDSYANTVSIGGLYNGITGNKDQNATDYKFQSTATKIYHSIWLSNNTNINDSQFYYAPTMYEVNGQEPTIQELIDGPDTQAPTAPMLSSTSQTDTTVDLSWTAATDNVAVTGYKVYKDAVLEATLGNVLTYQVTGLTVSTSYNFTVTALDAAGNESVVSNIIATTTNSAITGNLLDTSTWTAGTGSVAGFIKYGPDEENIREMGIGPHNTSVLLWKTIPDGLDSNAGGWKTDFKVIDPTKTYRFTVWMKKTNSNDGTSYFGLFAENSLGDRATNLLNGTANSNPYFQITDLPTLDNWYLLVGYIHQSTYANTNSIGGTYDPVSGNKVLNGTDFKFQSDASTIAHRVLLASGNTSDNQFYYAPTIYEVNGQEPTIQELIDGSSDTQAPTAVPTLSNAAPTDTTVDLSWTAATDNVAVIGYKVYKDAVLEATLGNVLTYQVAGLSASTSYNFTVTALDAAGNESVVSNTVVITTNNSSEGGSGNWTLSNQDVYYNTGNVGIGTSTPDEKLAVNGNIHTKEVRVDLNGWSDFVFEKDYKLPTLKEVEKHIKEKGHLKDIPSAKNVEEHGILLGDMNAKLLQKIEELTLYILQQQKTLNEQVQKNKTQEERLTELEKLTKK